MISTSDKAGANQKLYNMMGGYKTVNLFAPERSLYFMSDVPHLLKTIRNNFEKSSFGSKGKHLWVKINPLFRLCILCNFKSNFQNGQSIVWEHVKKLYQTDVESEFRRTRLTLEHVKLTDQSKMRVYLAAQVKSGDFCR